MSDRPGRRSASRAGLAASTAPPHAVRTAPPHAVRTAAGRCLTSRPACCSLKCHAIAPGLGLRPVSVLHSLRATAVLCSLLLGAERGAARVLPAGAAPWEHSFAVISLWTLLKASASFLLVHLHARWVQGSCLVSGFDNGLCSYVTSSLCQHVAFGSHSVDKRVVILLGLRLAPRQGFGTAVRMLLEFFCP